MSLCYNFINKISKQILLLVYVVIIHSPPPIENVDTDRLINSNNNNNTTTKSSSLFSPADTSPSSLKETSITPVEGISIPALNIDTALPHNANIDQPMHTPRGSKPNLNDIIQQKDAPLTDSKKDFQLINIHGNLGISDHSADPTFDSRSDSTSNSTSNSNTSRVTDEKKQQKNKSQDNLSTQSSIEDRRMMHSDNSSKPSAAPASLDTSIPISVTMPHAKPAEINLLNSSTNSQEDLCYIDNKLKAENNSTSEEEKISPISHTVDKSKVESILNMCSGRNLAINILALELNQCNDAEIQEIFLSINQIQQLERILRASGSKTLNRHIMEKILETLPIFASVNPKASILTHSIFTESDKQPLILIIKSILKLNIPRVPDTNLDPPQYNIEAIRNTLNSLNYIIRTTFIEYIMNSGTNSEKQLLNTLIQTNENNPIKVAYEQYISIEEQLIQAANRDKQNRENKKSCCCC